jgi:hypothetical protein
MSRFVTIGRSTRFSPGRHADNDRRILDEAATQLCALGWSWAAGLTEAQVEAGHELPAADLVLNMAQGAEASKRLRQAEGACGARFVNTPAAVLACHRTTAVARLRKAGAPWVPSLVVDGAGSVDAAERWLDQLGAAEAWLKRGDVHAMGPADVQRVPRAQLGAAVARMRARLAGLVVVQPHLQGPTVKFYGIGTHWLRWLWAEPFEGPRPDPERFERPLHEAAVAAASCLGLELFGGDAVLGTPEHPTLIDVNDWPSFAPFREQAALAIAHYAAQLVQPSGDDEHAAPPSRSAASRGGP